MNDALCLDGPFNGCYASLTEPPDNYQPYVWPTGETVLIHSKGFDMTAQELIRFIQACREDGRAEALELAKEAEKRLEERDA